jgi:hypothetical protein
MEALVHFLVEDMVEEDMDLVEVDMGLVGEDNHLGVDMVDIHLEVDKVLVVDKALVVDIVLVVDMVLVHILEDHLYFLLFLDF